MVEKDFKCLKCGHQWPARVERPLECPNCKARLNRQRKNPPNVQAQPERSTPNPFKIEAPEEL